MIRMIVPCFAGEGVSLQEDTFRILYWSYLTE